MIKKATVKIPSIWGINIFQIVAIFVISVAVFAYCDNHQSHTNSEPVYKEMSLGEKLAALDAGSPVDKNDIKVNRINTLLDFISTDFREPRDTIAEYVSKCQGVLENYGVKRSCQEMLEDINAPGKIPKDVKFKEFITMYATVLAKQHK